MNKKSTGIILTVAIVLGVGTALAVYSYIQKLRKSTEQEMGEVIVAAVDIKPRSTIAPSMVAIQKMPLNYISQNAATRLDMAVGKVNLEQYRKGSQILMADLTTKDKVPGLAYVIPEGKRAVTIKVDEVKGVGYSVHPGDHVDILATYRDPVTGQQLTQIILQRLEVLAIDQAQMDTTKGGKGAASNVTLAVTPEEAAKLTVTDMEGALRMVLRPEGDKTVIDLPAARLRDLVKPGSVPDDSKFLEPPPTIPIGSPEPPKVRYFRGSEPMKEVHVGD